MTFQLHFSVLHIFFPSLLPQFPIGAHKKNVLNSLVPPKLTARKARASKQRAYLKLHFCVGLSFCLRLQDSHTPGKAFSHFLHPGKSFKGEPVPVFHKSFPTTFYRFKSMILMCIG